MPDVPFGQEVPEAFDCVRGRFAGAHMRGQRGHGGRVGFAR